MMEVVRWGFLYATLTTNGQWSMEIGPLFELETHCEWHLNEKYLSYISQSQNPQMQMWLSKECTKFKVVVVYDEFDGDTDVWLKAIPGGRK
jgi:hypothetical protein